MDPAAWAAVNCGGGDWAGRPGCPGSRRYNPAECAGIGKHTITGNPNLNGIASSYGARRNLTMRRHLRRFTRLTHAFSKKLENHTHAISLYCRFYNFCKIHKTPRVTPAMAAGITDHV